MLDEVSASDLRLIKKLVDHLQALFNPLHLIEALGSFLFLEFVCICLVFTLLYSRNFMV